MDIQSYRDKDDFLVEIGTVVAYEAFSSSDNETKTYVVRRMPNLGDTLILSECLIGDGEVTDILSEETIEVEPWRVGAI